MVCDIQLFRVRIPGDYKAGITNRGGFFSFLLDRGQGHDSCTGDVDEIRSLRVDEKVYFSSTLAPRVDAVMDHNPLYLFTLHQAIIQTEAIYSLQSLI